MQSPSELFVPPHCPNPNCRHHAELAADWRFKRTGTYRRQLPPYRIQRFLCLHCRRSFSTQTFSTSYWLKRPDILRVLLTKTVGAMANRQIARDLAVAPSTVDRQLSRLGRHCLLFHLERLRDAEPPRRIAIDGFVTFEHSQYWPFHHHLAIEPGTDFMLYFTDSEVRRSGAMTPAQRRRREVLEAALGRPDPQAVLHDVRHLLEFVIGGRQRVTVISDDHLAYRRALRELDCVVVHQVTPSKERRDARNPLFPVNLVDRLLRHSSANHRRETIAWSKRRQASAERLAIFLVWRNYLKGRQEKVRGSPTPAQARGLLEHRIAVGELLAHRLFIGRNDVPERWRQYYLGEIRTRALGRQRRHTLTYAT